MIYFDNRLDNNTSCEQYYKYIETTAKEILDQLNVCSDAEISVSLVEPDEIKRLNKQYRGIDSVTDVLSFPLLQSDDLLKESQIALGDIVICFSRAKEQANEYGHSLKREIAFLTAHSMLHLLGFDHETNEDEKEMFELQEKILLSVGIERHA